VFSRNALYKFTFYITLHYITSTCSWVIIGDCHRLEPWVWWDNVRCMNK